MVFTAFLLGAQHKKDSADNKPASLPVVFLGKALYGTPSFLCGRQVAGQSSPRSWWPSLSEDSQTEHEVLCSLRTSRCMILSTIAQTTTMMTDGHLWTRGKLLIPDGQLNTLCKCSTHLSRIWSLLVSKIDQRELSNGIEPKDDDPCKS